METLKNKRVLITGAAGRIGKILRTDLAALFDLTLVTDTPIDGLKCQILDLANDYQRLRQVIDGHQTVVHLAYLEENDTNTVNFKMAKNIFSVVSQMSPSPRVIVASSIHVVGGYLDWQKEPLSYVAKGQLNKVSQQDLPLISQGQPKLPNSFYGAMKCYIEHLGEFYSSRGLEVVVLRLGGVRWDDRIEPEPGYRSFWLSRRDCSQIFEKAILVPLKTTYVCVFGVSNNTYRVHDISSAQRILGYEPLDNAESFL